MPSEQRAGLGARKVRRAHPASPVAVEQRPLNGGPVEPGGDEGLVMLCVRVAPSLRRRLKLLGVQTGRPIQALVTEALERVCTQDDV